MSLRKADYVSELLNIPKARVYELVRENVLPVVRIGERQIRFDEEALRQWIANGGRASLSKAQEQTHDN
jgi:excisionase family DNA binding protein